MIIIVYIYIYIYALGEAVRGRPLGVVKFHLVGHSLLPRISLPKYFY